MNDIKVSNARLLKITADQTAFGLFLTKQNMILRLERDKI